MADATSNITAAVPVLFLDFTHCLDHGDWSGGFGTSFEIVNALSRQHGPAASSSRSCDTAAAALAFIASLGGRRYGTAGSLKTAPLRTLLELSGG
eukprot:2841248-Amphidinium_carterae.2